MFDTPGSNRDRREGYRRNHHFRVERRERARWCPGTRTRSPRRRSTRRRESDAARGGTRWKAAAATCGLVDRRTPPRPKTKFEAAAAHSVARPSAPAAGSAWPHHDFAASRTTTEKEVDFVFSSLVDFVEEERAARTAPISMGSPSGVPVPCVWRIVRIGAAVDRASSIAARIAAVCDGPFGAVRDELRPSWFTAAPATIVVGSTSRNRPVASSRARRGTNDTERHASARTYPSASASRVLHRPEGESIARSENFRDVRREEDVDAHHRRAVRRRVRTRAASVLPRNLRRDERGRTRGVERDGGSAKVEKTRATRRDGGERRPSPRATTTRPRRSRRRLARDRSLDSRYPRRHPFDSP